MAAAGLAPPLVVASTWLALSLAQGLAEQGVPLHHSQQHTKLCF